MEREPDVSIREVMSTEYVAVNEGDTMLEAAQLMHEEGASVVVVLRGSEPVGVVTESDVLALVAREDDPADVTVGGAMSSPVLSVPSSTTVASATRTMADEDIRKLLVRDGDDVRGVVTERDVIAAAGARGVRNPATAPEGIGDPVAGGDGAMAERAPSDDRGGGYTRQGICKACGSLSESLADHDGQVLCADCREM
ncbi:signal transduction protein [Halobacteriales archaeon SW_7_68_16]|nr:MAG: signal transduction protein [Halobacteriales archaeon SW_7_68_16]